MFDAFIPSDGVYNRATMTAVADYLNGFWSYVYS